MNDKRKDNLTDVASQIANKPQDNSNQPQNLADNQVIGNDGAVINLNNDSPSTVEK